MKAAAFCFGFAMGVAFALEHARPRPGIQMVDIYGALFVQGLIWGVAFVAAARA